MPSYVVTGVSRGIGWEFLNQLSSNPDNKVVGIVRNKAATDKRVAEELSGRSNISILQADLTDYESIKKAAATTSEITGGSLDYLIANAAIVSFWDFYQGVSELVASNPKEFAENFRAVIDTNVLGNTYLLMLFLPLILKGETKKVAVISSGAADMELVREYDIHTSSVYAVSKAAMNMITAKFSAEHRKNGVLFLSICPGMVEVGHFSELTPQQGEVVGDMVQKFKRYSPDFKGPDTPEDSVKAVLSVIEKSSVANGDGGAFLSHFGTKRWV